MTVLEALKGVLKLALIHDGLARGLREASKALDRRQAHMCVLNEGCEEEAYKKLVVALCGEHQIPLIKVPDGKMLGEWAGLCECLPFSCSNLLDFFQISYYEADIAREQGGETNGASPWPFSSRKPWGAEPLYDICRY